MNPLQEGDVELSPLTSGSHSLGDLAAALVTGHKCTLQLKFRDAHHPHLGEFSMQRIARTVTGIANAKCCARHVENKDYVYSWLCISSTPGREAKAGGL